MQGTVLVAQSPPFFQTADTNRSSPVLSAGAPSGWAASGGGLLPVQELLFDCSVQVTLWAAGVPSIKTTCKLRDF